MMDSIIEEDEIWVVEDEDDSHGTGVQYRDHQEEGGLCLPCIRAKKSCKIKNIPRDFKRRIIRSKAIIYIIVISALHNLCFYFLSNTILRKVSLHKIHHASQTVTFIIGIQLSGGLSALFYPIGGILGDVYFGRHLISIICLFISFVTSAIFAFSVTFPYSFLPKGQVTTDLFDFIIPITLVMILTVVDGIFELNWLTFGADQLINSPSEEVSSYIYWWSWTRNAPLVAAILINTGLQVSIKALFPDTADRFWTDDDLLTLAVALLATILYAVVIMTDLKAYKMYDRKRNNVNPIKHIFGVIVNACISRPKPVPYTSAFRYGEDPPSGLDYARKYHDGNYTDEEVESVRSFGKILLMVTAISGYYPFYLAFHNKAGTELHVTLNYPTATSIEKTVINSLQGSLDTLIDSSVCLILLPVWNHLVWPLMGHNSPNTRKRIGLGTVFGVLGMLVAGIIHINNPMSPSKLYPIPLVLISIGETLVLPAALEFIYAQSPDNMKGLLIGFNYLLLGVWAALTVALFYYVPDHIVNNNKIYYFWYFGLGFLSLCFFTIVSCKYRNRKRNNPITDIMRISSYYSAY